ncbi:MAG: FtsX-like permease family protein, partial [Opitutaceae bacterium]
DFRKTPLAVLIGVEAADKRLLVDIGDSIQIESKGEIRRYRVAAIYKTGVSDIDKTYMYLHIGESRSLLKKPIGASFLQVNIFDRDRAPSDAEHMTEALGYNAQSWQEREKSWLSAFSALRISSGITVSVFTLIAGLAMFNTLAMIVLEKTKDIAILRSMGYERADITRIFLWQAIVVLVIGIVIGSLFGAGATYAVSRVPLPHGGISGIFATKYFVVDLTAWHFVEAATTAIVTVLIASLIPARRAARLEPGDIVRGTAQ